MPPGMAFLRLYYSHAAACLRASGEPDAQETGEFRGRLERSGARIGEYDTLIAGQAFCRNLVLVTANTREFARVKGLVVEDWTA